MRAISGQLYIKALLRTHAAVAEKTSTNLPFVRRPNASEKMAVNTPMMISRVAILLIK